MDTSDLDIKKLNMIKVKVIQVEKENTIQKDSNDEMVERIRKYVEKVVDSKC